MAAADDAAVAKIATTPALLAEARTLIPQLRHRARTLASDAEIKASIGRRLAIYPQGDMSAGEWSAWWTDYAEALAGVSAEAIEEGLKAWIAKPDARFMPKPGELRAIAQRTATPTLQALNVLDRAALLADEIEAFERRHKERLEGFELEAVRLKHVPKPPEDREWVARSAADFRAEHARREAERPRPVGRSTAGELAPGSALTPQMLRHLGRPVPEPPEPEPLPIEAYQDDPLPQEAEGVALPWD